MGNVAIDSAGGNRHLARIIDAATKPHPRHISKDCHVVQGKITGVIDAAALDFACLPACHPQPLHRNNCAAVNPEDPPGAAAAVTAHGNQRRARPIDRHIFVDDDMSGDVDDLIVQGCIKIDLTARAEIYHRLAQGASTAVVGVQHSNGVATGD